MSTSCEAKTSPNVGKHAPGFALGLIIGYKLAKALVELSFSAFLLFSGSAALLEKVNAAATIIRHHVAEAWSIVLAERLVHVASARSLLVIALALLLDGVLALIEGWALYRRYRWGRWLVVYTTSIFLPLEIIALIRHVNVGRGVVLLVNALIVIYLVLSRVAVPKRDSLFLQS